MYNIGLISGGFQHAHSSTLWKSPTYFNWDKGNEQDITFFIDEGIEIGLNSKCDKKFAWLVESRTIIPGAIDFVKKNAKTISESYIALFTHYKEIYEMYDNFIYVPPHGYWIENPQIYNKTKMVSMVSSSKRMCKGHDFRLNWVNKLKNKVDLYGNGFNFMKKKEEGLKDYMFSVTIENDQYETYWSEKILDCFACGTIPIYHGSPDVGDFFNMDGVILLNDDFNIGMLSEELYFSKMEAIKDNLSRTLKYNIIEDIIFENWVKKYV